MAPYGSIWVHLGPSGPTWAHINPYGSMRAHLGPYGSIWIHLAPCGSMWDHMDSYGSICDSWYMRFLVYEIPGRPSAVLRPTKNQPSVGQTFCRLQWEEPVVFAMGSASQESCPECGAKYNYIGLNSIYEIVIFYNMGAGVWVHRRRGCERCYIAELGYLLCFLPRSTK